MLHSRAISRYMKYLFSLYFLLNCVNKYLYHILDTFIAQFKLSASIITHGINWKIILLEMLQSVFFFDEIVPNSVLLVNMIKNNTTGVFQVTKITSTLIDLVENNSKEYYVVSMKKLYDVYRKLDISSEEILNSYAYAIEIAHNLKADYIIYGIISGNFETPKIELQLILSKTGEIIRTINRSVNYNDYICND